MADERKLPNAADVFAELEAKAEAEKRMHEKVWSLGEIAAITKELSTPTGDPELDVVNQRKLQAMQPVWAASNERGDFKSISQMNPTEIKKHFGFGDNTPFFAEADIGIIYEAVGANVYGKADDPLPKAWRDEMSAAQKEGRLILGVRFEESDDNRAARLNRWGAHMEQRVEALGYLRESLAKIQELKDKNVDTDTVNGAAISEARRLYGVVDAVNGQPFDVRNTSEFRQLDMLITEAGGYQKWTNAVADKE